jgi:hypothetical protein
MMSDENVMTPTIPTPDGGKGMFGFLEQRRREIVDAQVLTLEVPRWTDPKLLIRFAPVDHEILKRGAELQERVKKEGDVAKISSTEINTNADILINACIEIVMQTNDGKELGVGVDGRHTKFDQDMAISLGMPESSTARAVCKEIFITSGDLLLASKKLGEWSGYREGAVEEAIKGE